MRTTLVRTEFKTTLDGKELSGTIEADRRYDYMPGWPGWYEYYDLRVVERSMCHDGRKITSLGCIHLQRALTEGLRKELKDLGGHKAADDMWQEVDLLEEAA